MSAPNSAQGLPSQMPNTSQPIVAISQDVGGQLFDSLGKPIIGVLTLSGRVTMAWRYLFGTFVQRSSSVNPDFTLTASNTYSQSQIQSLIDQVESLSQVVGKS